ncbi:hypothetical protein GCM10025762_24520 [Haloechinothrix salitolerans]
MWATGTVFVSDTHDTVSDTLDAVSGILDTVSDTLNAVFGILDTVSDTLNAVFGILDVVFRVQCGLMCPAARTGGRPTRRS